MWVGGLIWSQTFIDHCFYGIFDCFWRTMSAADMQLDKVANKVADMVADNKEHGRHGGGQVCGHVNNHIKPEMF